MSLSDICCEVTEELAKSLGRYCSWSYDIQHWLKILDAIYLLNEVGAELDIPSTFFEVDLSEVVEQRVILSLLNQAVDVDSEKKREAVIALISRIALDHDRLRDGIIMLTINMTRNSEKFDDFPKKLLAELYQRSTM